jgi:hypothetical protein
LARIAAARPFKARAVTLCAPRTGSKAPFMTLPTFLVRSAYCTASQKRFNPEERILEVQVRCEKAKAAAVRGAAVSGSERRPDERRGPGRVEHESVTLVYLAYGPPRFGRVAAFSALTFLYVARQLDIPWRLAVYTDRPDVFEEAGIDADVHRVAPGTLHVPKSYIESRIEGGVVRTGADEYPYRGKIEAMQHAAETYAGALLFIDSDTYFTDVPSGLFRALGEGQPIMHTPEYPLGSLRGEGLDALLDAAEFENGILRGVERWSDVTLWNSGVIGLPASAKHLIADALAACDEIYAATRSRVTEQLAWTVVLSQAAELLPADAVVSHYWHAKEEMMYRIVEFLRRNRRLATADLAAAAYAFKPRSTREWRPPLEVRVRIAARGCRDIYRALFRSARAIAIDRRGSA